MQILFTDEQLVGLQAGCDSYNESYKASLSIEDYAQMLCQERAQSCINQYVKAYTLEETVQAKVALSKAGALISLPKVP